MSCLGLCLAALHLLCLVCLVPPSRAGSAIGLQATPPRLLAGLSPALTLRCSLNTTSGSASIVGRRDVTSTVDTMADVMSIVVMKNGSDVASVSHSRPAHLMDGSANVKVTGSVAGGGGADGFLQVTFQNPTQHQAGEFVCEVNAVSESGHVVTFSASQEVVMATPTTADLVTYVRQVNTEKDELADKYNDLNMRHNSLKAEVDTKVFFSAGLTHNLQTSSDVVVVFDYIFVNVGGAYNSSTGQFVCDVAGYYEFEASFLDFSQAQHWAYLQHNQQTVVGFYSGGGSGDRDMSSNSVILKLAKGDVVHVLLKQGSSIQSNLGDIYSTFSGKLVGLM